MKMKMGLKLSQQLRMTPQLQQAIKLLQLSRIELEQAIQTELQENPILEESLDTAEDLAPGMEQNDVEPTEDAPTNQEVQNEQDPQKQDEFEWENYIEQSNHTMPSTGGSGNEEIMNYENIFVTKQSLYDHLVWQLNLSGFNEEEKEQGMILISYVDDDGYIKTPLEEISADHNIPVKDLEEMMPLLQEFDPPGVCVRSLKECLLVQAKHLEEDTKDLVYIIENHLPNLEKKNFPAIAKDMNIPLDSVIEMCKIIYDMNPKPGRNYSSTETMYVSPDVFVYPVGDDYVITLNEDGLPKLKISSFYKSMLQNKNSGATQDYIQNKLKSAVWLIKSIHQRQRTIYKVTESIVKHQREFFDKGSAFLKPMILRDIANDIGMHESTVSRVTNSKYMHTPQGIFELKHFFNTGIGMTDGDSMASESVKLKIKQMLSEEDTAKPLSDQKIVEILEKQGIEIARRTVAKYREALGILPSSKRKKYF